MLRQILKKILIKMGVLSSPVAFSMEAYLNELRLGGASIGENVDILSSTIDAHHLCLISIGDNVTITHATLLAHDASTKKELGYTKIGHINIGSNVFIGFGSIILPNVSIGNKVIVGAGTIVSHDIPENSVVAGNPAQVICSYDEYMCKHRENLGIKPVFQKTVFESSAEEQLKISYCIKGVVGYAK